MTAATPPTTAGNVSQARSGGRWRQFRDAPLVLQVFSCFIVLGPLVSLGSLFVPRLNATMVPYTGWLGGFLYANALYFTFSLIFQGQRKLVYAVLIFMGLFAFFGVSDVARHLSGEYRDFKNPYLEFAPLRPMFTVALPVAWLMLLLSPSVRQWIHEKPVSQGEPRRHQFSVKDLLYWMAVVAVFAAISLQLSSLVRQHREQPAPQQAVHQAPIAPLKLTRRASECASVDFPRLRVGLVKCSRSRVGLVTSSPCSILEAT